MKTKKKAPCTAVKLSTLDEFLKDEGKLEEFEAVAIEEVLAWQDAKSTARCGEGRRRSGACVKDNE